MASEATVKDVEPTLAQSRANTIVPLHREMRQVSHPSLPMWEFVP